jgi:hypothetical protein
MSATQRQARLLAVAPVPFARLPNEAWLSFLDGPLTASDWAIIDRVERGDLSVDDAMALKEGIAA